MPWDHALVIEATDLTWAHPMLRSALLIWQSLARPVWVYLVAVALCWFISIATGRRRVGWWATGTILLGWALGDLLKVLVHRHRPVLAHPVTHLSGYSFPSGHAVGMALACATVLLAWRAGRGTVGPPRSVIPPMIPPIGMALAGILIVLTDLDRVFLGVHYPSDVVAGSALGLAVALASYRAVLAHRPDQSRVYRARAKE